MSTCSVVLMEKHVIFDLYYDLTHYSAITYLILLGKVYIYKQKMNEKTIYLNYFFNELKFKLDIEKIARWAYEYNRHGFLWKAISVPPPSINNDGYLMQ